MSTSSKALPLVYGTCRIKPLVIERHEPVLSTYPPWQPDTAYCAGDRVTADDKRLYECAVAGRSAREPPGPTGEGLRIIDGFVRWDYVGAVPKNCWRHSFVGVLASNPAVGALALWYNGKKLPAQSLTQLSHGLVVKAGTNGPQTLRGFDRWSHPGLQHMALIGTDGSLSETQHGLPKIEVEFKGIFARAEYDIDSQPIDIITDILCDRQRGCGWPEERIDTGAKDAFRIYCNAAGLRFSLAISQQQDARSILAAILEAANSEALWSQGALKILPLGDQPIARPVYGRTAYVPDNAVVCDLGPDDFLDVVRIERRSDADSFNAHPIEAAVRSADYEPVLIEEPDSADTEKRGICRAPTTQLPMVFRDVVPLKALSQEKTKRSLHSRNEFRFVLGFRHLLLEPGDVCTLTDPVMGLERWPVRITEVAERTDGLDVVAIDWPAASAA